MMTKSHVGSTTCLGSLFHLPLRARTPGWGPLREEPLDPPDSGQDTDPCQVRHYVIYDPRSASRDSTPRKGGGRVGVPVLFFHESLGRARERAHALKVRQYNFIFMSFGEPGLTDRPVIVPRIHPSRKDLRSTTWEKSCYE